MLVWLCFLFFFFSSRRRHTRLTCDWTSDVCSSDLAPFCGHCHVHLRRTGRMAHFIVFKARYNRLPAAGDRSEERRVGKGCRGRWEGEEKKTKTTQDRLRIYLL